MKYLLCCLLCFKLTTIAFAQKQGNMWFFGEYCGLDFNSGAPVAVAGCQIAATPSLPADFTLSEGTASIADSSGQLLFYSNGQTVWNRFHQPMPNGWGLMGFYSSTTAAFIVPRPLSSRFFYVFTTDGIERQLKNGLRYSIVDMCANNGLGEVMLSQKNILLLDTVSEKLTAVAHPNGVDVWLIAHKYFSDAFYAYLITPTGISAPVISRIGYSHGGTVPVNTYYQSIGQMKASPDGKKIALVVANTSPSHVELYDFSSTTGVVSNLIDLPPNNNEYSVEFSPDNSKLYIRGLQGFYQYNLQAGGGAAASIIASKFTIAPTTCFPSAMQLGPDGKIYVLKCNTIVDAIQNPNGAGATCNYTDSVITLTNTSGTCFPSFIAGFQYRNTRASCLDIEIFSQQPGCGNPCGGSATAYATFGTPPYKFVWFPGNDTTETISNLCPGTYILQATDHTGAVLSDTIVIYPAPTSPTFTIAASDTVICAGEIESLCIEEGFAAYKWSTGSIANCVGITAAGMYRVTVTGNNGCPGEDSIKISDYTVFPVITSGKDSLCVTDSTQLCAPAGYASYVWNTGHSTPCFYAKAGSYYAVATDSNGCVALSDTVTIDTFKAGAAIIHGPDSIICAGDSVQLCIDQAPVSLIWNTGESGFCIYPAQSGNYYAIITDSNGCTYSSNRVAVSVYPVQPIMLTLNGDTITVYNATNIQWYHNGNAIAGANGNTFIAGQPGAYTVSIADSNNCLVTSAPVIISSIENHSADAVRILPNPVTGGNFQLEAVKDLVGGSIEISNAAGQVIYRGAVIDTRTRIELSALRGVYLLRVYSSTLSYTGKLFVW